jgi:ABC-type dipeptide/oligopeptide/nickel transport system permease component
MLGYVARRGTESVLLLFGASVLVFLSVQLVPGDPVRMMFGEWGVTPEQLRELRGQLGLDDPLAVQYVRYVSRLLHGDLGTSMRQQTPVTQMLIRELPHTLELAVAGLVIAIVIGVGSGVVAAVRRHTVWDTLATGLSLAGLSIPAFWLGLIFIFVFSLKLQWVGAVTLTGIGSLVLPSLTLGLWAAGIIGRMVRTSMLEVLSQDYLRTARAKGLTEFNVVARHAIRNALIPVVAVVGIQFGHMLSGAVIVEAVFARPGLGRLLVAAIVAKDLPVVQGAVLSGVIGFVVVHLWIDIWYGWLDPRVRLV